MSLSTSSLVFLTLLEVFLFDLSALLFSSDSRMLGKSSEFL